MRDAVKYFLVYNETSNRNNKFDEELTKKNCREVQPSSSFDHIAKTLRRYAKEEYICFGLKMFQNYCFKEVHTYTEAEFESYLATLQR